MNCPACAERLVPGAETCPACGALVAAASEGALAPDPELASPPRRSEDGRIVEIPGLKRREPTWKDEVRERVRHRRRRRHEPTPLPLFEEEQGAAEAEPVPPAAVAPKPVPEPARDVLDLPLRTSEPLRQLEPVTRDEPALGRLVLEDPPEEPWPDPAGDSGETPLSLERPASFAERVEAAAVDGLILGATWMSVVYLAGKAARVDLAALLPTWPYLLGFLAFLGLGYAAAFTGLTGQTPGKMLLGLRVVDGAGGRPGPLRAALRALVAVVGIAALGLGVFAILLDPARRALHDRVLKTRVVRG